MRNDLDIRFDILSWMETKKVFTVEDLSAYVSSIEVAKQNKYIETIIELIDSPLVVSWYGYYSLRII